MTESKALVHIQHILKALERIEDKQDEHIVAAQAATAAAYNHAEKAHNRITAHENKVKGIAIGSALGGTGIGAALVKFFFS